MAYFHNAAETVMSVALVRINGIFAQTIVDRNFRLFDVMKAAVRPNAVR